jgi:hypothetical protein
LIETDDAGSANSPQVAVDASGNAVAIWRQSDGARNNIWANHFVEDYPPALSLASPAEGSSTNQTAVWVAGMTEPSATVSVNGVAASIARDGSFGLLLVLAPGANVVEATAWDAAGNSVNVSVNVTYEDPVPALVADLAAAEARVAAIEADQNATQADLDAALAGLAAAEARVDALEAAISAIRAELESATARSAEFSAELNLTVASIQQQESDLEFLRERADSGEAAQASRQAAVDTAAASAGMATAIAALAVVLAVAGIAAGFLLSRRSGGEKLAASDESRRR